MDTQTMDALELEFWKAVFVAAIGAGNIKPANVAQVADEAVRQMRKRRTEGVS